MTIRKVKKIYAPMPATDGAGVKLLRVIGQPDITMFDPFLLLDEFGTENPDDYIAGFPSHPHRGFETVTYMLDGVMHHEDSTGSRGDLISGGVQWMTAGKGVIHSETPKQKEGLMRGFQLWVNLPAKEKMRAPHYQNIEPKDVPVVQRDDGVVIKIIAGNVDGVEGAVIGVSIDPLFIDITIPPDGLFTQSIQVGHNAFAHVVEGSALFDEQEAPKSHLVTFEDGSDVLLRAGKNGARLLLIAGKPLHEPVARSGPFVMNTSEEIRQAIDDYRSGGFQDK